MSVIEVKNLKKDYKILQKANIDAKEFLRKESLDDYIHIKNELSKSLDITHV